MNKKGNTLVEVIVSIVVVSILVGMLLTVFTQSKRVQNKLNEQEMYINETTNVFNLFTSDPSEFKENMIKTYNVNFDEDNATVDLKKSYMIVNYSSFTDNKYSVTINIYDEDDEIITKYSGLTRTIIDMEVNND